MVGDGPIDLVVAVPWISHLEVAWEEPNRAHVYNRLASFSRLILFDKRGTGMSDRVGEMPPLEGRIDDLRAVMDAAGSETAAVFGMSDAAAMAALFAATYPDRTSALVMYGGYPKRLRSEDYPWGQPVEYHHRRMRMLAEANYAYPDYLEVLAPSWAGNPTLVRSWNRYWRFAASPSAAQQLLRAAAEIDIRPILPTIRVPTLIVHREGDRLISAGGSRFMAEHIPDAKLVLLPGDDHLIFAGDSDRVVDEVEQFLTGVRHHAEIDRVLLTVMFVDMAGSTELASELGDRRWKEVLDAFKRTVRYRIAEFRGHEVDNAGDGFLLSFDGPARAIRCACAITQDLEQRGVKLRVGLHTGECEVDAGKVSGIAVHIGARVKDLAQPGEVLVSRTVKDLVAGSGIAFQDRKRQQLRGVPGEWHLYAAQCEPPL